MPIWLSLSAALFAIHTAPAVGPDIVGSKYIATCGSKPTSLDVFNPPELVSHNGVLNVTLGMFGNNDPNQHTLCYVWNYPTSGGKYITLAEPPTLHLKQGDRLVLTLINTLIHPGKPHDRAPMLSVERMGEDRSLVAPNYGLGLMCGQPFVGPPPPKRDPKTHRVYGYHRTPWNETNLHFHGLNTSPRQPSDDVLNVLLCPVVNQSNPEKYVYTIDIPANEPPGTYWYHPHPHGESESQLLAGLTGVIIVDTYHQSLPDTLPNRVIVIRDTGTGGTVHPRYGRTPSPQQVAFNENQLGPNLYHRPGGYPFQDPDQCPPPPSPGPTSTPVNLKNLTVNHVPVNNDPNTLKGVPRTTIPAGETHYYRFVNTSSDTILDIVMTLNGKQVPLQVTSRDGVPLVIKNGQPTWQPVSFDHVFLTPAARTEFYVTGANAGDKMVITTLTIDTGCLGDATYQRNLLEVGVTPARQRQQIARLPQAVSPVRMRFSDLDKVKPTVHRTFAFTEYNAQLDFYITQLSDPNAYEVPFEMGSPAQVHVKAGTVEDWTILNYTQETHMFHMHQIHFLVRKAPDYERGLGQMLDMVDVPYGMFKKPGDIHGNEFIPGMVDLLMDFRDKNIIGEFPFHCHILAHEDNGMMAKVNVEQ